MRGQEVLNAMFDGHTVKHEHNQCKIVDNELLSSNDNGKSWHYNGNAVLQYFIENEFTIVVPAPKFNEGDFVIHDCEYKMVTSKEFVLKEWLYNLKGGNGGTRYKIPEKEIRLGD